jgi:hypothetical protein
MEKIDFREMYEEIKDTPYFQALLEEGYKKYALKYAKDLLGKSNTILIERMIKQGIQAEIIASVMEVSLEKIETVRRSSLKKEKS